MSEANRESPARGIMGRPGPLWKDKSRCGALCLGVEPTMSSLTSLERIRRSCSLVKRACLCRGEPGFMSLKSIESRRNLGETDGGGTSDDIQQGQKSERAQNESMRLYCRQRDSETAYSGNRARNISEEWQTEVELDAACNNPTLTCHIIKARAPEWPGTTYTGAIGLQLRVEGHRGPPAPSVAGIAPSISAQ